LRGKEYITPDSRYLFNYIASTKNISAQAYLAARKPGRNAKKTRHLK